MIDTHAHIYLPQFEEDLDQVMSRAQEAGITKIMMPNIDSETIEAMHRVEEQYPDRCFSMMGLHPCSVSADPAAQLEIIRSHLDRRTYVAIGEIGIDLHWDDTYRDQQIEAFRTQCLWAVEFDLPIVIHSRKSLDLIISLLQEWSLLGLRGIFHCFGGSLEQAAKIIELGFIIGIGGVVTFKNTSLREVLREISPEYVVLETDSPYLAPTPHRGKRNEPSYVTNVASQLSDTWGVPLAEIIESSSEASIKLFSIKSFEKTAKVNS